jgi:hypothetical protein
MQLYKVTDHNGQSRGGMQWGTHVTHSTDSTLEPKIATASVIHTYASPLVAMFLWPAHISAREIRLWDCEGEPVVDDGITYGCRVLTCQSELPPFPVTIRQRVVFAILCAKQVYNKPQWDDWADRYITDLYREDDNAARAAAVELHRGNLAALPAVLACESAWQSQHTLYCSARAAAFSHMLKRFDINAVAKRAIK